MIVNAPPVSNGGPLRALVLKKWYKVLIQVTGPNTVTIGTSKSEAGVNDNGLGVADGLQFNNTNAFLPFEMWWIGEFWASGSGAGCTFVLIVPGLAPSVFEAGGAQECELQNS